MNVIEVRRRGLLALALAAGAVGTVSLGVLLPGLGFWTYAAAAAVALTTPSLAAWLRARDAAAAAALAAGTALLPLTVGPSFLLTHPMVHVDNALGRPVQVWVDGKLALLVPPGAEGVEPARLRLSVGRHLLAYSSIGGRPVGEVEIEVVAGRDHLYNPGLAGCYWLEVTAYGGASTHGQPHGPQSVDAFHRLPSIHVWFGDTPRRVTAARLARGAIRIALQRHTQCMELGRLGCSAEQRDDFVRCQRVVNAMADETDCFEKSARACSSAVGVASP